MIRLLPAAETWPPLLIAAAAAVLIALRYSVMAGGALAIVTALSRRLAHRRIQSRPFTPAQLRREFGYSMSTACVFGLFAGLALTVGRDLGLSKVYFDPDEHGLWWLVLSLPAVVLLHDAYFYWTHRFMHLPGVFERVHRVHHLSTNPSPLSVLAFHPLEAVIAFGAVVVITALVPVHVGVLALWSLSTLLTNIMGHLGYELLPPGMARSRFFGWINTATSHNQHHRAFAANFGLYTLLWDRLMGTVHPGYVDLYHRTTDRTPPSGAAT